MIEVYPLSTDRNALRATTPSVAIGGARVPHEGEFTCHCPGSDAVRGRRRTIRALKHTSSRRKAALLL
jgi:hypothetical protein